MEIGTIGAGAFAQAFAKRALKAGYKVKLSNSRGPNGVYFLNPKLPSVIGGEGAGIVEAIGPGVTSVKVGDRVTISFGTFTWSEKVLAPARGLFVVPPSIDARTASMLNINPTTAVLLLDEFVKLAKDWIVLNAANSQVARCLIAIAQSRDLNVIGIVRRSELIPEIEKLGVDFVGVDQSLQKEHSCICSRSAGRSNFECCRRQPLCGRSSAY